VPVCKAQIRKIFIANQQKKIANPKNFWCIHPVICGSGFVEVLSPQNNGSMHLHDCFSKGAQKLER
jgi:hypothetical protein